MKKLMATLIAVMLVLVMAMPALGSPATPSAEQTRASGGVKQNDKNCTKQDFLLFDANGNELTQAEANPGAEALTLVVTPYASKDSAPAAEIKTILENAKKSLDAAGNLSALSSEAQSILDAQGKGGKINDMQAADLFDVSFMRGNTYVAFGESGAATVGIAFKTSLTSKDPVLVFVSCDGNTWDIASDAKVADDGTLTVNFDKFCAVAFATEKEVTPSTNPSPQTGDISTGIIVSVALVAVLALCIVGRVIVDRKHA